MEKKNNSNHKFYPFKKKGPEISKDAAGLHMKVIVKKDKENEVTSIIIKDKENPFYGKLVGDRVTLKGESYKIVAIRSVKTLNAQAKKQNQTISKTTNKNNRKKQ